jgi:hypothetical protein
VALGTAPLALTALAALAAGRTLLSQTAVRRERIQEQEAAARRKRAKAVAPPVDEQGVLGAVVRV